MKYLKKPVTVDAWQWKGFGVGMTITNDRGRLVVERRPGAVEGDKTCPICRQPVNEHGLIETLEGAHNVCPGDYVIKGVEGEFYACKPSIFEKTYEPVGE